MENVDTFNPEEYLASKGLPGTTLDPVSGAPVPVDPLQLSQFDPESYIRGKEIEGYNKLQAKYGTGDQQALAALEAAGRGATLGLSDYVAAHLSTPEDVQARILANPATAMAGNVVGNTAAIALTGGIAAPLGKMAVRAGLRTSAARALGVGAESGAMALGNNISEYMLGDPNLNAQKVLSDVGIGFALGAGLGNVSKVLQRTPSLIRGVVGKEKAALEKEALSAEVKPAANVLKEELTPGGIPKPPTAPVDDITAPSGIVNLPVSTAPAKSIEELEKQITDYKKYTNQEGLFELPQKPFAESAAKSLEMEMPIPITRIQIDSLNGQKERMAFKAMAELPGHEGDVIRNTIVAQKKNLNHILDRTIDTIAPNHKVTTNAAEAGQRVSDTLTKQIEGIRKELGPAIGSLKKTPIEKMDHVPGVVDYLTDKAKSTYANPKLNRIFDREAGDFSLKPYKTNMGIDKSTYKAMKEAMDSLKDNPRDFETLFDVRKGLEQNVKLHVKGDAASEISAAKAAMMDYIQDLVQTMSPDVKVRELFKQYAKNENNAAFIEKTIGAKIGENWRSPAINKAEESILKKIFSNSAMTKAVKEIMPKDEFNKVLADYMKIIRTEHIDEGVFSANRFMSRIGKGDDKYALEEAFRENPVAYQKIKDVITTMRSFTDDMPINPSGTAKTIMQGLWGAIKELPNVPKAVSAVGQVASQKAGDIKLRAEINAKLAGTFDKEAKLGVIKGMVDRVNKEIQKQSKGIFESKRARDTTRGLILSTANQAIHTSYEDNVEKIKKFSSNPQGLMDHMAENTEHMYEAAPNITQNLHTSVMNAVQYLSGKIPQPAVQLPLSEDWQPNQAQKTKFNKYYNAVNNPIESLKQVKEGTLTSETMEALEAVHPGLLQEMRAQVLENIDREKAKKLPYAQKISLSKFLGQPLDSNLLPQAIQSNQAALNSQLSQQSGPKEGRKVNQGGMEKMQESTRTAPQSTKSATDDVE